MLCAAPAEPDVNLSRLRETRSPQPSLEGALLCTIHPTLAQHIPGCYSGVSHIPQLCSDLFPTLGGVFKA